MADAAGADVVIVGKTRIHLLPVARSPYNRIVSAGADVIQHRTLPETLVQLQDVLGATPGKALINLYWAGHRRRQPCARHARLTLGKTTWLHGHD